MAKVELRDPADKLFAVDWYGRGSDRDIVAYRPGSGVIWIMARLGCPGSTGVFTPVFQSSLGVGGFSIGDGDDGAIAFDNSGSGRMSSICLYRPGGRLAAIVTRGPAAVAAPGTPGNPVIQQW